MGTWLYSIHFRSSDARTICSAFEEVARSSKASFFIGPLHRGWIAVLADFRSITLGCGGQLARMIDCPFFEFTVADDDDFSYTFYRGGVVVDRYCANPEAFDDDEEAAAEPRLGAPASYSELFAKSEDLEQCEKLLRQPHFVLESDRLREFAKLLGIPYADYAFSDLDTALEGTIPGAKRFKPIPDTRPDKRRAANALKNAERKLISERILIREITPPGTKKETQCASVTWAWDSLTSDLYVRWIRFAFPERHFPQARLASPWRGELEIMPQISDASSVTGVSPMGRLIVTPTYGDDRIIELHSRHGEPTLTIRTSGKLIGTAFETKEEALWTLTHDSLTRHSLDDGQTTVASFPSTSFRAFAPHPSDPILVAVRQDGHVSLISKSPIEITKTFCTQRGLADGGGGTHDSESMLSQLLSLQQQVPGGLGSPQATVWLMRNANPEAFCAITISPDGKWVATGSNLGLKVWRWTDLLAAKIDSSPQPAYIVDARPGPHLSSVSSCYAVEFDLAAQRVIFAGLEGIVESLDLGSGSVTTLLRPPEMLAIHKMSISPDRMSLAVQSREMKINSPRRNELRLWDYEALCQRASLSYAPPEATA